MDLTRDRRWVYTWTAENRLRKMETRDDLPADVPDLTLEFKYDYLGRRIQKVVKVGGTTTLDRRYVWQGWRMIEQVNSAGAVQVGYEWGPDLSQTLEGAGTVGGLLRITDVSGGGAWESWISFPCYDANGNVMGLVGYATGNILAQYEYDPYGRLIRTTGNASLAASNPFLFATKFLDRETGLSYYGYRYYDAGLGRWVNRDPIGENGGPNLLGFAKNDSISRIDPLGLKTIKDLQIIHSQLLNTSRTIELADENVGGLLLHFLNGNGSNYRMSDYWVRGLKSTKEGIDRNLAQFREEIKREALSLKINQNKLALLYHNSRVRAPLLGKTAADFFALGNYTITSFAKVHLSRDRGCNIGIMGKIEHLGWDYYDFATRTSLPGLIHGRLEGADLIAMNAAGIASFYYAYSWLNQNLIGYYIRDNYLYFDDYELFYSKVNLGKGTGNVYETVNAGTPGGAFSKFSPIE